MAIHLEALKRQNERFYGKDSLWSKSLLAYPRYTDSPRMIMNNNMLAQRVVLNQSQKPKVFTNYEDAIGRKGSYNRVMKRNWQVARIIKKFKELDTDVQSYLMFVYDPVEDYYDVFERKEVENLPEKYGFSYDNRVIDGLKEGDSIAEGTMISNPTCFDEYGNYGYGRNVPFMYQISTRTLEDAITVTKPLADTLTSTEVDVVTVSLNDNDMLLNTMGDIDHYKCFPEIGEMVQNGQLCVRRNIARTRLPFDLKEPNTRKVLSSDKGFYVNGMVVDIDIYCNKSREELINTVYNEQVLRYLDMLDDFRREVRDYTAELILNGHHVSDNIKILNKRYSEQLNKKEFKIKDDNNSAFSNIRLEFTIKRPQGLFRGQKLTGRVGNKGVIGSIIEDYEAFYLENGTRIDIIFDTLGVINRLNTFQLFEQGITFRAQRVLERIIDTKSMKEKENLLFTFIRIFDDEEAEKLEADYRETCKTAAQKKEYFKIVEEHGIYVHIPPFWMKKSLYDCLLECDKTFPWIEPYKVFFYDQVSKRWVLQMNRQYCGTMYIMKLKQSSKKGLSARSTGSISKKGIPEKSDEAKRFHTSHSKIPVRFGIQERDCKLIRVPPELTIKETIAHRSSPQARRALAKAQLLTSGGVKDFELTESMSNRNVEILSAHMLLLGCRLVFNEDRLNFSKGTGTKLHFYQGKQYFCTTEQMTKIVARDIVKQACDTREGTGPIVIGTNQEKESFLNELTQKVAKDLVLYVK